eukprot:897891-Amphidinium_carterae.1
MDTFVFWLTQYCFEGQVTLWGDVVWSSLDLLQHKLRSLAQSKELRHAVLIDSESKLTSPMQKATGFVGFGKPPLSES